jgi:cation diffusion facilitator CzcD-associated flavoprotein CzcO
VNADREKKIYTARFVILSTGYYDYNEPLKATIPGIDNFQGQVIHPQFWPEDLDYTGKKVVIIGSGATAITLLPNLAEKAAKVTMLQRSPSYIMALPAADIMGDWVRRWFPNWIAHTIVRWKCLILPFLFFKFCTAFPNAARKVIQANTQRQLPPSITHDPNFKPAYNPWEQRLCVCPDGDFFQALRKGNSDIVTDTIKTVTASGIQTDSGKTINTDIIITATGLRCNSQAALEFPSTASRSTSPRNSCGRELCYRICLMRHSSWDIRTQVGLLVPTLPHGLFADC